MKFLTDEALQYFLLEVLTSGTGGIIFRKLKFGFHRFKEQMQSPEGSFSRLSLKAALLKQAAGSLTTDPVVSLDRDLSNWGADRSPALPGSRQDLTPPEPDC